MFTKCDFDGGFFSAGLREIGEYCIGNDGFHISGEFFFFLGRVCGSGGSRARLWGGGGRLLLLLFFFWFRGKRTYHIEFGGVILVREEGGEERVCVCESGISFVKNLYTVFFFQKRGAGEGFLDGL